MKLEARGLSVSAGGARIVENASLHVASGELVGLIGPNGAGKSTLLKALLGLQPRTAGEVLLDGAAFDAMSPIERARRVAFFPQERRVEWRLRVRDVVMLGRYPHQTGYGTPTQASERAVDSALRLVEAEAIADRSVATLSSGERTLVLLARALAVEAPLLLVDEPTTALDPYHQLQVMETLAALARRGVGVLAVIHDLAAARFMDRVVLMSAGAVVGEGTPAETLTDENLLAIYQIEAVRGMKDTRQWIVPWSRKQTPSP
ncbi:MAG: ABC transporter ATP-binding protein [Pseudomonadota bacterium]